MLQILTVKEDALRQSLPRFPNVLLVEYSSSSKVGVRHVFSINLEVICIILLFIDKRCLAIEYIVSEHKNGALFSILLVRISGFDSGRTCQLRKVSPAVRHIWRATICQNPANVREDSASYQSSSKPCEDILRVINLGDGIECFLFCSILLMINLPSIPFRINYHYLHTGRMRTDRRNDTCRGSLNSKYKYCIGLTQCRRYMHKIESK